MTKRYTYEQGIGRIDEALENEFWLEASWIIYAMFEDRCSSLLEKSGGAIPSKNGFVSIHRKIEELKARASKNQFLAQVTELPGLLQEVNDWKKDRNTMMHSLVEMPREWSVIDSETKQLAKQGRNLLGRFSSAAMKVRKKYVKAGNK